MTKLVDFVTSFPVLIAVSLGLATLISNWLLARTNRLNAIMRHEWEKEKWSREQTSSAYRVCLEKLSEAWHLPFESPEGKKLQVKDFLGRMSSLRYVPAWAAVLESYSSQYSRKRIQGSREELMTCMRNALQEALGKEEKDLIAEHGLTTAIDNMLKEVISCTKTDLTQSSDRAAETRTGGKNMLNENDTRNKIDAKVAYEQIFHEMRRYRDYELTVATWWNTVLLALFSGIIWAKSQAAGNFAYTLSQSWTANFLLTAFVLAMGAGILHSLRYTSVRYSTWRSTINQFEEPDLVKETAQILQNHNCWKPLYTIVGTTISIVSGILILLWYTGPLNPDWYDKPPAVIVLPLIWILFSFIYWGISADNLKNKSRGFFACIQKKFSC
jgi:hypothetical protein